MVVANVSQVNVWYSNRCLLMKNKFTEYCQQHIKDTSKNEKCFDDLYSTWWNTFMNRINDTKNFGKTVKCNLLQM